MLIQSLNGFICLKSWWELKEAKVVEAIFMFFEAEFFDFPVLFEESFDFIFNLFFGVVSIEVGKEEFVAVGVFSLGFFLFAWRRALLVFVLPFD